MHKIEKPWGFEVLLEKNKHYVVKFLMMNQDCRCSLQYHEHKLETIFVLDGVLDVEVDGVIHNIARWGRITIQPGQRHRMGTSGNAAAYLEASTPELDDVIRLEDDYGRINDTSKQSQNSPTTD